VAGEPPSPNDGPARRSVRLERIALIHAQGPLLIRGSFLAAIVTAMFVHAQVDPATLSLWLAANVGLLAVREWNLRDYRRQAPEARRERASAYAARFTVGSVVNGVLWGLVPVLFAREDTTTLALLFAIHGGYTAASATTSVLWWPSFLAFVLPSSALFIGATLYFHFAALWSLAVAIALFTVLMLMLGRRNLQSLTTQIELRLVNQSLLDDVRAQRDRAEAAMNAKSRFLAAASHDLRQPVHALTLFTYALEPHARTPEAAQLLAKMRESTEALGGLFHGLLDLSQLDAEVVRCEPRHVRLDALFGRLADEFRAETEGRGLYLELPPDAVDVAFVDLGLLEPVLRNLIGNAVKYTEEGGVRVRLEHSRPGRLCVAVHDTGRGIPPEELENVFSEYHQLENPERDRRKGLGLGLAIVRRLCDLMGTELTLQSRVGEGSVFTVCVPYGDPRKIAREETASGATFDLSGLEVLVIDDEPDILEGMGRVLDQWSCRATLASSLTDALERVRRPPDLIIADYRLREHATGIDAVKRLRDEYDDAIPAVLVTGDSDPARLRDADSALLEVLHKPIDPPTLRRAMERQLRNRSGLVGTDADWP